MDIYSGSQNEQGERSKQVEEPDEHRINYINDGIAKNEMIVQRNYIKEPYFKP